MHPELIIIITIIMFGMCGIGLMAFKETKSQEKLWVPKSSRLLMEKDWVDNNFDNRARYALTMFESDTDVLVPQFLLTVSVYLQFSHFIWPYIICFT